MFVLEAYSHAIPPMQMAAAAIVRDPFDIKGENLRRKTKEPCTSRDFIGGDGIMTPYMRNRLMPQDSIAEVWRKCGRIRRFR
jgi:hypothetical protein